MSITDREYGALREEILKHFEIVSNTMLAAIAATGAILAFAGSKDNPWLYLAPLAVIIPTGINHAFRSEAITRIGTYLVVFGEDDGTAPAWETRHRKCMSALSGFRYHTVLGRLLYTSSYLLLGLVCLTLFFLGKQPTSPPALLAGITALLVLVLMEHRILMTTRQEQPYLAAWRKVRSAECASEAQSRHAQDG